MNGPELRAMREALHLTQAQLAAELGVSPNTVARWERGEMAIRSPKMVETAMKHLREVATVTKRMTPAQAWEGFVGSQTPAEFLRTARERDGVQDIDAVCTAYAQALPTMFDGWDHSQDLEAIAGLLAQYIRQDFASTAEELAAALNEYADANPWSDVVLSSRFRSFVDEATTEAADPSGASDIVILVDGTRVCYYEAEGEWQVQR